MKISENGLELIKRFEGYSAKVYKDAAGLDTVGWGHLLKEGESFPDGVTKQEAEALLKKDVGFAENAVNRYVKVKLTQSQFDSLCSFVYNVGARAFFESTLLKWLNKGRIIEVPVQLVRWNKAGGKVLLGLLRRRIAESALFLDLDEL